LLAYRLAGVEGGKWILAFGNVSGWEHTKGTWNQHRCTPDQPPQMLLNPRDLYLGKRYRKE
jgi:hypothetical protein